MKPNITTREYIINKSLVNNKLGLTGEIITVEAFNELLHIKTREEQQDGRRN